LWFAYEESRKAGKNSKAKTPKPFKRVDASQVGEERP
jgi:hypothetical protein